MSITSDQFRKTMALFPTGVTVVTFPPLEGQDLGITISSLTSVSLSPPQVLFCLSKKSRVMPCMKAASFFAVNLLSAQQAQFSPYFAQHDLVEWEKVKTLRHALTGCLLLADSLGHILCEKGPIYEGGGHEIILGTVIDVYIGPVQLPLVRHAGQYLTTHSL